MRVSARGIHNLRRAVSTARRSGGLISQQRRQRLRGAEGADRGGRKRKHEVCRWVLQSSRRQSGNAGTARRVRDWPWGMPNSLDVVLMQVAYERRIVAIGVLRPHAGLAALRGSV